MEERIRVAVSPFFGGKNWVDGPTKIKFEKNPRGLNVYSIPLSSDLTDIKKQIQLNALMLVTGNIEDFNEVEDVVIPGDDEPVIEKTQETKTESIPFEKIDRDNPDMLIGENLISQQGVNGVLTIIEEVTTTDGVETDRVEISRERTTEPVDEITDIGTKEPEPEPEEPEEKTLEELVYEATVEGVMEMVENNEITAELALEYERVGKNRSTLIQQLEELIEGSPDDDE